MHAFQSVNAFIAALLAYPCGIGMAAALPRRVWKIFGYAVTLNPGQFSLKEVNLAIVEIS